MSLPNSIVERIRQNLSKNGFAVLPEFINQDALDQLGRRVTLFYKGWERLPPSTRKELKVPKNEQTEPVREINWPREALKILDQEPAIQQIKNLINSVSDSHCQLIHANSLLKPARNGAKVAPHQDTAYNTRDLEKPLTVWIPFETASPGNGTVSYLAGSHRIGPLPHLSAGKVYWIDDAELKQHGHLTWQDCCGSPGTIAIHDSRVVHASHINRSDRDRLALSLRFAAFSGG